MAARLTLTLPWPPSTNAYWVAAPGRGMVPTKAAIAYRKLVRTVCVGARPLLGRVLVSGDLIPPRLGMDLDNRQKALFDALNGVAWLDDKQVWRFKDFGWANFADSACPRVELRLTGEAFASPAQVEEDAARRASASAKRRATLKANRAKERCPSCGTHRAVPCPRSCPTRSERHPPESAR